MLLNTKIQYYEKLIAELNAIDQRYAGRSPLAVAHVTDLDTVRLSTGDIEGRQYGEELFRLIQNSSTNRNRKRAAWALKRFFCDDLTPINVEAASSHVGGQHGSDPACYSCHYKLDPMAGYFRELGFSGVSFASSPQMFFDDGANASRVDYGKPWKAAPETGREWNVGYIRSTTDDKLNTFGSNFTDLERSSLVPPPWFNLTRYYGVFASAHVWREFIVPMGKRKKRLCPAHDEPPGGTPPPPTKPSTGRAPAEYWIPWAELLLRSNPPAPQRRCGLPESWITFMIADED